MGSSRRKHSREFKIEAVKQVVEKGRSVSDVAQGLGLHPISGSAAPRPKPNLAA